MARLRSEAAAWGLALELPPEAPTLVWPENWPAFRLFCDVQSQWRTGPGGPIGLDYNVLPAWCRPGCATRRGRRTFAALQIIEREALRLMLRDRKAG